MQPCCALETETTKEIHRHHIGAMSKMDKRIKYLPSSPSKEGHNRIVSIIFLIFRIAGWEIESKPLTYKPQHAITLAATWSVIRDM